MHNPFLFILTNKLICVYFRVRMYASINHTSMRYDYPQMEICHPLNELPVDSLAKIAFNTHGD